MDAPIHDRRPDVGFIAGDDGAVGHELLDLDGDGDLAEDFSKNIPIEFWKSIKWIGKNAGTLGIYPACHVENHRNEIKVKNRSGTTWHYVGRLTGKKGYSGRFHRVPNGVERNGNIIPGTGVIGQCIKNSHVELGATGSGGIAFRDDAGKRHLYIAYSRPTCGRHKIEVEIWDDDTPDMDHLHRMWDRMTKHYEWSETETRCGLAWDYKNTGGHVNKCEIRIWEDKDSTTFRPGGFVEQLFATLRSKPAFRRLLEAVDERVLPPSDMLGAGPRTYTGAGCAAKASSKAAQTRVQTEAQVSVLVAPGQKLRTGDTVELIKAFHGNPVGTRLEVKEDGPTSEGWYVLWQTDKLDYHYYKAEYLGRVFPPMLHVQSTTRQNDKTGMYKLVSHQMPNGMPVWKQEGGTHWLYSGTDKKWCIGGDDVKAKGFNASAGWIISKFEHGGVMPNEIALWRSYKSEDNNHQDDPGVAITTVQFNVGDSVTSKIVCDHWKPRAVRIGDRGRITKVDLSRKNGKHFLVDFDGVEGWLKATSLSKVSEP